MMPLLNFRLRSDMKHFSIVVAMDEKRGIGKAGGLPWRLSRDMQRFKDVTITVRAAGTVNAVIMGRKTWESLPVRYRPLPGRLNVVLSSDKQYPLPSGSLLAGSLDEALRVLWSRADVAEVFVIGGGILFDLAIAHPACQCLFVTHIQSDKGCDVFFPKIPPQFQCVSKSENLEELGETFCFCDYKAAFQSI